jgi:hypothetical protein
VAAAVPLYERLGFRRVCPSLRFRGRLPGQADDRVRPLQSKDLEAVLDLDRRAFGADRSFFIHHRLRSYPQLCRVLVDAGRIRGFVLGRAFRGGVALGPWVTEAELGPDTGLLRSLAQDLGEIECSMGIMETNRQALAAVQSLGLAPVENPPWRMVLSGQEAEATPPGPVAHAIGSAAKG